MIGEEQKKIKTKLSKVTNLTNPTRPGSKVKLKLYTPEFNRNSF